MEEEIE
jgi:hypothetical protein